MLQKFVNYPSVGGTESPLLGIAEDVAATRDLLSKVLDGKKEVLPLYHLYGGVVGNCSVERIKEGKEWGVKLAVYMTAFMIPKGKSLLDMLGGQLLPCMNLQEEETTGMKSMIKEVEFNDMSDEKAAVFMDQISQYSASMFATPSTFEPWVNGIDCAYIFRTKDKGLPLPIQRQMPQQLGPGPARWSLKAGHCPYMVISNQALEALRKAADWAKGGLEIYI
ncbi:hypothetical protein BKA61DRAFT_716467 [Leptodontidium sp. MPI-SDFR-AT-0119]|nr:hypothetical protein BKA61DRAFT_716467 [Leptodontidium sp. MPI-SDFR-AT-0119]